MAAGMCPGCSVACPRQPAFGVFLGLHARSFFLNLNAIPWGRSFPCRLSFKIRVSQGATKFLGWAYERLEVFFFFERNIQQGRPPLWILLKRKGRQHCTKETQQEKRGATQEASPGEAEELG